MEAQEDHRNGSNKAPGEEGVTGESYQHAREVFFIAGIDCPSRCVDHALEYYDSAQPSVQKIVRIETDVQEWDQGIVATRQDEQRHHIEDGQSARPAAKLGHEGRFLIHSIIQKAAISHLTCHIQQNQDRVKPRRQGAHINRRRELDFPIVSFATQRCVEKVLLNVCPQS